MIDLLIHRVETTIAKDFGDTADADYNVSLTTFKIAVKLIKENNLKSCFSDSPETKNLFLDVININY